MPGMDYKMAFGRERGGNPANISFQVTTFGGNLAEFQAKILKEAPITFAALGITNFKVTKMSGFETTSKLMGLVAVAQAQKPDGKSVRQFYFFFDLNDRKKVLVSCSVADEGTNYDDEFIAILKTFRSTR